MKKTVRKSVLLFILGFCLLFIFRLIYGYVSYPTNPNNPLFNNYLVTEQSGNWDNSSAQSRWASTVQTKNYASKKIIRQQASGVKAPLSVDQKYEKVSSVSSKTEKFELAEKRTRQLITDFNALIQFEQKSGLTGRRYLHLAIGVDPTKFEEMTDSLAKIGKLVGYRVDKVDKTSEFKNLQVKKTSLEKNLSSLISFKSKGGKLEELIALESKILEMEEKIQALGIDLGEFDEENEFCTVKYTLEEFKVNKQTISFIHRLKVAFEWTIEYYAYLIGLLFAVAVISLIGATVIRLLAPLVEKQLK